MSNQIGVAADGTTALGNAGSGVVVLGQGNIIGGRVTREGNLISGNGVHGVFLSSGLASENLVLGNRVGTDADGKGRPGKRRQRHLDRGGRQRDRRAARWGLGTSFPATAHSIAVAA